MSFARASTGITSRARVVDSFAKALYRCAFVAVSFLAQVCIQTHAAAAPQLPEEIGATPLTIKLHAEKKRRLSPGTKRAFRKFCAQLGEALTSANGPFGEGIFPAYSCRQVRHRVTSSTGDWLLEVRAKKKMTEFHLFFVEKAKGKTKQSLEASTSLPNDIDVVLTPNVARLVALAILDSLPFARTLDSADVKEFSFKPRAASPAFLGPPPTKYAVFTLRRSNGNWLNELVGHATLQPLPSRPSAGSEKQHTELKWTVTYTHRRGLNFHDPKKPLWVARLSPRGGNYTAIAQELAKALPEGSSLTDFLGGSFAAGYAGFRYGIPIMRSDPLLKQSHMVGVFTEVRSGPLNGLRWYWDFAPKVETQLDGQKFDLTWSRVTFGWSFGLEIPGPIDKIDIVPKLGLMDFDATLAVADAADAAVVRPERFRARNVTNLGIEAGAEADLRLFLFRVWGAADLSGFVNVGGSTKVSSLRGGADAYFQAVQFQKYKLSVLLFVFSEEVSLARNEEVENLEQPEVKEVEFNLFFAGPGLILTW